ncbi:SCO family protein [Thermomicrobium sp. CFH 73360]|uniref:SCO family protein n=1 Tax=Thermomicrobium sp. CFH 73360 TaxID=2951987 RepID=UPI0020766BB9|nr:SCO family protein [Thermomicrobium sp. CFH 73360]MCM8744985.1 SCO family protein [Thermomicrobium sp. CFH 73360]
MLRRIRNTLWILACVALVGTGVLYAVRWYQAQRALEWALELDGRPAPDFTLLNQTGQTVQFSSLEGRAFIVTFVYTSCPDTCPLTLRKLVAAYQRLPQNVCNQVQIIAITVDPERDTPTRVQQYLTLNGFGDHILYLTGDPQTLESVWADFAIAVVRQPLADGQYEVAHTTVSYILDSERRIRYLIRDEALDPERLAGLLERLVAG